MISKWDCLLEIFPKIYNVSDYMEILKNNSDKGPIIKDNKIKEILKMLETPLGGFPSRIIWWI